MSSVMEHFSPTEDQAQTLGLAMCRWLTVFAKRFSDGENAFTAAEVVNAIADLAKKADASALEGLASGEDVAEAVRDLAKKTDVDEALAGKADTKALAGYVTTSALTTALADKANASAVSVLENGLAGKAPLASPALTGKPTAPTPEPTAKSTEIATAAFVNAFVAAFIADQGFLTASDITDVDLTGYAKLASPVLTGMPTAPTATAATNTNQIATAAFVKNQGYAIAADLDTSLTRYAKLASPALTGTPTVNGKAFGAFAFFSDAPADGKGYFRKDGTWVSITDGSGGPLVGEIRLLPFRVAELPDGWHFCNGGGFATTSAQGQVLASLSVSFRNDWGITVSGATIYLPNLFNGAAGYFLRPVTGTDRMPGTKETDTIRNITGLFNVPNRTHQKGEAYFAPEGAVELVSDATYVGNASSSGPGGRLRFDASRVVPTADENRPANIGMTPAIYLGV